MAGQKLADDRPLAIRGATLDRSTVEVFTQVELTADIAATYENPFDPDQIAVDAEEVSPDGQTATVPGLNVVTPSSAPNASPKCGA